MKTSRPFRVAALLAAIVLGGHATGATPDATAANRPNVLIWLMDDVGYGHPSPFGGPVEMPTLHSIADKGLRFTNFHSTAICSSSRAALLNGRNHHVLGMGNHAGLVSGDAGYTAKIPASAASLATILRDQGYSTWALGKIADKYFEGGMKADRAGLKVDFTAAQAEGRIAYDSNKGLVESKNKQNETTLKGLNADLAAGRLNMKDYTARVEQLA